GEAVEPRGHGVVVLGERPGAHRERKVHARGEASVAERLEADLPAHRAKEVGRIDAPAEPAVQHLCARRELERHRDGDGPDELPWRIGAPLAEPLQQDVAAERDADRDEARRGLALQQQRDHVLEVVGVPRVVELRQAVQLAAARAEVQRDGAPAAGERQGHEALRVVRARRALEPVEDEEQRRARAALAVRPVEIHEIAVARGDPLAPHAEVRAAPEERAPRGLDVRVPAPPGGSERRGAYSWPCSRRFTTSGAISRARWSSSASVRFAIGCGIARNRYVGTPHCSAIALPVTSNTSVTIEAEGTLCFSSRIPSSTLPDEQEPQSPMPATT